MIMKLGVLKLVVKFYATFFKVKFMSKIGKKQISIPQNTQVNIQDGTITIIGDKGKLTMQMFPSVDCKYHNDLVTLSPKDKIVTKKTKALWGLARSLINNMIIGTSAGFSRKLEINGVGYKVVKDGASIILSLGYSHDIIYPIPQNVDIACSKNTIEVSGCDKQLVGQVCAEIRRLRKPEPYKGKGIIYEGEVIVRKEGKKK